MEQCSLSVTVLVLISLASLAFVCPDPLCWSWPLRADADVIKRPCCGGLCRCTNFTADCSCAQQPRHTGQTCLPFVPRLPGSVQALNLSNNNLTVIEDRHFFDNLTSRVWILDLYNNGLTSVVPEAVQALQHVRVLKLGGNRLTSAALRPILALPRLASLDLKCGGYTAVGDMFNSSRHSTVKSLDLGYNGLATFDLHDVQALRSLSQLKLTSNAMIKLTSTRMPALRYLGLKGNELTAFPDTCDANSQPFFPRLTELNLQFNYIVGIRGPICLPRLSTLRMEFNKMRYIPSGTFSALRFPALSGLQLTQMVTRIHRIDALAFNNSAIRYLGLGNNYIDPTTVSYSAFAGCTGLSKLYFDYNYFRFLSDDQVHGLFEPLTALRALYLGRSQVAHISRHTFSPLKTVEELYLYGNSLTSLPDGAFDSMPRLTKLGLGENYIPTINKHTFGQKTRQQLQKLGLDGNPFQCTCDILWFQSWLVTQPSLFTRFPGFDYRCSNLNNTRLVDLHIPPQACLMDKTSSLLTIVFIALFLVVFVVTTLLFRFRWHLRLLLYEVCRERHRRRREERGARQFQYDVFVAYAEQDLPWLQRELLPVMEGQWGLRLCIHQRDFMPGEHIVDNISDSVHKSYRQLMVFSPHFARSEWCQFELNFCQVSAMHRDDVLLLVILQETQSRDLTAAMLAVMQTTTYIEWSEEDEARRAFWGRLRLALTD